MEARSIGRDFFDMNDCILFLKWFEFFSFSFVDNWERERGSGIRGLASMAEFIFEFLY